LADIYDEHSEIDLTQFGGAKLNTKGKPLFRIVDNVLPFKDNSFDYVICSHVFEHVPLVNLPKLAAEIMRVSKRAYIEFPRPAYDYIYNFHVHLNLLDIVNGEIICIDKNNTKLNSIKKFQEYAMQMRNKSKFVVDKHYSPITAVGAEFIGNISIRILQDETAFWSYIFDNTYAAEPPTLPWMVINKLKKTTCVIIPLKEKCGIEQRTYAPKWPSNSWAKNPE
jgi:hypothetical protein